MAFTAKPTKQYDIPQPEPFVLPESEPDAQPVEAPEPVEVPA